MTKKDPRRFYVYAYLRSNDSEHGKRLTPYYIGKGARDRATSKQRTVPKPSDPSFIVYIQEGMTEQDAFRLEQYCIALYGRIDKGTGILRNLSDGGDGPSGTIVSEARRQQIAESSRGRTHPPEVRRKIGDAQMGSKNHMWGKAVSQETREKISAANKGLRRSEKSRQNIAKGKCKYKCVLVSPTGQVHQVDNFYQFCLEHKLHRTLMLQLLRGERDHYKAWTVESVEILR
jgi:hypothetical protein